MKRTLQDITPDIATQKLEALCVKAEHSAGELREKLYKWKISSSDANSILEHLIKNHFVDDSRFAKAYVNDKVVFSKWGRRKIKQGLYQKKISTELINKALAEIDEDLYQSNLKTLLRNKIKASPTLLQSYEGRTKIFRFAVGRGYEADLTAQLLTSILDVSND